MELEQIQQLIGSDNEHLLTHTCKAIPKSMLQLPAPGYIDTVFAPSDRNAQTLRNLALLFGSGRLAGTGYLSILPVDQGIEHSAGSAFAANPEYFDPENIVSLAREGGCNAVATTIGALGLMSRKYAHKIPFIVKLNHNELLSYPNKFDQVLFGTVRRAWDLGATAIGATVYFGSAESSRQIAEIALLFEQAHALGMPAILWCYLRNKMFTQSGTDYQVAADLTGQANHLGATLQADIIKQKLPVINGGYKALNKAGESFGKWDERMYSDLCSANPIDLCRYQVLNSFAGRAGLLNSGGAASGMSDLKEAVITAIINKRAGGMGVISGRKAFQRPFREGVNLLHAIQDVYLAKDISIA